MNALELAFWIEDPASLEAVELAQDVLWLLRDRDSVIVVALTSEVRALNLKYPRISAGDSKSTDTQQPQ